MNFLLISPYNGGSHQAWSHGYQKYSQHTVDILALPARFWKWRMHGGAATLARRFLASAANPDLILATDMLDLTTFLALTRQRTHETTAVLYMHENQLTYPLPADGSTGPMRRQLGERDHHYAFINYASMLAANHIFFNSAFHRDSFFAALPGFLKHFPEYNELGTVSPLTQKSSVLPVGVDFTRLQPEGDEDYSEHNTAAQPPLVLWNQRWEYDKNPDAFFDALYAVADEGIPFRLALCGQQYGKRPSSFEAALKRLSQQLIHVGHADRQTYRRLLWQADVTVSTAHHEFFGISILEAIQCHTWPLLPHRLSYPELIPAKFHSDCLYSDEADLVDRLKQFLSQPGQMAARTQALATAVQTYDWSRLASEYDARLVRLIQERTDQPQTP